MWYLGNSTNLKSCLVGDKVELPTTPSPLEGPREVDLLPFLDHLTHGSFQNGEPHSQRELSLTFRNTIQVLTEKDIGPYWHLLFTRFF